MKIADRLQPIQLILSDVDGVMTDGGIQYDNQGVEYKQFHVRDGMGIKLWQQCEHRFGIVTARTSHIVKVRASELGIEVVRQGFEDKLAIVEQLASEFGIRMEQICFVGDDLTDLRAMQRVGLAATVADGVDEVKQAAHLVLKSAGGRGALRELIELILKAQNRWDEAVRRYQVLG